MSENEQTDERTEEVLTMALDYANEHNIFIPEWQVPYFGDALRDHDARMRGEGSTA